jgi:dTDP-4-dehydrorhamnose 3,5-epimerase
MSYYVDYYPNNLVKLRPKVYRDARGFFFELFQKEEYKKIPGLTCEFTQTNFAYSFPNVLRGLHFQIPPKAQGKLVTCTFGRIWDVVVDLRPDSMEFCKWKSFELNDLNHDILYIPPGFAHGYFALTESMMQYFCTDFYSPEHERGIRYDDPVLNIPWVHRTVNVSEKDLKLPYLEDIHNDLGNWWKGDARI